MTHPLANHLAPIMNQSVEELHTVVAEWVMQAPNEFERARYRVFGAEDRVEQEVFPAEHSFWGKRGIPFLARHLNA